MLATALAAMFGDHAEPSPGSPDVLTISPQGVFTVLHDTHPDYDRAPALPGFVSMASPSMDLVRLAERIRHAVLEQGATD